MVLYGSSIWDDTLQRMALKFCCEYKVRSTIRVTRAYRTDAHNVVRILAGMITFRNTADAYTESNDRIRKDRSTGVELQNHGCVYEILIPEAR